MELYARYDGLLTMHRTVYRDTRYLFAYIHAHCSLYRVCYTYSILFINVYNYFILFFY